MMAFGLSFALTHLFDARTEGAQAPADAQTAHERGEQWRSVRRGQVEEHGIDTAADLEREREK